MSSYLRRMQRMPQRELGVNALALVDGVKQRVGRLVVHKNPYRIGSMLGVKNPDAKDLLARQTREKKHRGKN